MAGFSYSPRIERRIAVGRLTLASFSLLGMWLDPSEPARHESYVGALLGAQIAYGLLAAWRAWKSATPPSHIALSHCLEVLLLSIVLMLSEGPGYFLWPVLVFAFLSGGLRWQWPGTLGTGGALLVVSAASGVSRMGAGTSPDPSALVIRCAALAVIALLVGRLSALEARGRRQMRDIATPPNLHLIAGEDDVGPMLAWAGRLMGAPRVLLAWDEGDEPMLELALWDGQACRRTKEGPNRFYPLVAARVERADFLHRPPEPCLIASPTGFRRWNGEPLHEALRARFAIGPVLAIRLDGDEVSGRLLFLDNPHMTSDDLVLGEIIAHQVTSRVSIAYLMRRLEESAALEERVRLARNLHDGVVQSLMGMALEVDRLLRAPGLQADDVRQSLRQIQAHLHEEQRTLRALLESLRASEHRQPPTASLGVETRIRDLVTRIERQRGLTVDARLTDLPELPVERVVDVCLIVHEALANVARHSGATSCRLEVEVEHQLVRIAVRDDGRGFPFKGRYDHDQLAILDLGPATLMQRAALLGGSVTIDSTETGASVLIRFPLMTTARGAGTSRHDETASSPTPD